MTRAQSNPFMIRKNALPDWMPAPGQYAKINLNVATDNDPCPSKNCVYSANGQGMGSMWTGFSGGVFAKDLGRMGTMLVWGGGESAYWGNEVHGFDYAVQRWKRFTDPSIGMNSYASGLAGPNDVDYMANGWNEYRDGTPANGQTYDALGIVPPSMGGGRCGSLYRPLCIIAYGLTNGTGNHMLDLSTWKWKRACTAKANMNTNHSGNCTVALESRKKMITIQAEGGTSLYFSADFSDGSGTGVWDNVNGSPTLPWIFGTRGTMLYDDRRDIIVTAGDSTVNGVRSFCTFFHAGDMSHGPIAPTVVPTVPGEDIPTSAQGVSEGGYGFTHDLGLNCYWVYVPAFVVNGVTGVVSADYIGYLWKITPSSNLTSPWTSERSRLPDALYTDLHTQGGSVGPYQAHYDCHQGIWKRFIWHEITKSLILSYSANTPIFALGTG